MGQNPTGSASTNIATCGNSIACLKEDSKREEREKKTARLPLRTLIPANKFEGHFFTKTLTPFNPFPTRGI